MVIHVIHVEWIYKVTSIGKKNVSPNEDGQKAQEISTVCRVSIARFKMDISFGD